jgi:hypothetical protein
MPVKNLDDKTKNKLDPGSFKEELGEDILNGYADEASEQKEEDGMDIDDLEL